MHLCNAHACHACACVCMLMYVHAPSGPAEALLSRGQHTNDVCDALCTCARVGHARRLLPRAYVTTTRAHTDHVGGGRAHLHGRGGTRSAAGAAPHHKREQLWQQHRHDLHKWRRCLQLSHGVKMVTVWCAWACAPCHGRKQLRRARVRVQQHRHDLQRPACAHVRDVCVGVRAYT